MRYEVVVGENRYEVEVEEVSPNVFKVSVNGKTAIVEMKPKVEVEKVVEKAVAVEVKEAKKPVKVEGKVITSPMNGIVTKVLVKPGDEVKTGDTVAVIEAMKMENPISSPFDGVVEEVFVKEGDKVSKGDPLLRLR
ncbi:MAG: biotin/lipoyl-containing protein [Archaeoglobaceae archaeon]